MNAYAVNTKQDILFYSGSRDADGYKLEPDEYGAAYEVIIAESRGAARNILTYEYGLEFTHPLHIHTLACGIDLPRGSIGLVNADDEHHEALIALWVQAAVIWHEMSEPEEFYLWQSWYEPERLQ